MKRRWPSSRTCWQAIPTTFRPWFSSVSRRRPGAGSIPPAIGWPAPATGSRERGSAVLPRRGPLQSRPHRARPRCAQRSHGPEPGVRRSPLPPGIRLRRSGPARGRQGVDQEGGRSSIRCWPAPRRTWRWIAGRPRRGQRSGPLGVGADCRTDSCVERRSGVAVVRSCPPPTAQSARRPAVGYRRPAGALQSGPGVAPEGLLRGRAPRISAGPGCWRGSPAQPPGHGRGPSAAAQPSRRARALQHAGPGVSRLAQALERAGSMPASVGTSQRGACLLRESGSGRFRLPAGLEQSRRPPRQRALQ